VELCTLWREPRKDAREHPPCRRRPRPRQRHHRRFTPTCAPTCTGFYDLIKVSPATEFAYCLLRLGQPDVQHVDHVLEDADEVRGAGADAAGDLAREETPRVPPEFHSDSESEST